MCSPRRPIRLAHQASCALQANTETAKHRILRLRLAALRLAAFGSILRLLRLRLAAFCVWGLCVCLRLSPGLRLLRLALLRLGLVCTILRLA